MEGTGGLGGTVKCQFFKIRRVNTARQSKGLPSSHYLIIGIILKEPLMDERNSDEPPSRLSNDHLERRSFVRRTSGGERMCVARREARFFVRTIISRGRRIFLPNFSLKLSLFYRKRKKKKKEKK